MLCPACVALLGCPVCFALYAGTPAGEASVPENDAVGPASAEATDTISHLLLLEREDEEVRE